jgi:hypothetical protein
MQKWFFCPHAITSCMGVFGKSLKSVEMHWNIFYEKSFSSPKNLCKNGTITNLLQADHGQGFAICITKGVLLFGKFETLCGCNPLGLI